MDEARNDQLYALEIAIEQIYKNRELHGQSMPPRLVDRTCAACSSCCCVHWPPASGKRRTQR